MGIPPGGNFRGDCPFCFHKNSFSVSRQDGRLKWYCFFASCSAKGDTVYEPSAQEIFVQEQKYYRYNENETDHNEKFVVPSSFSNIRESNKCMEFLMENNCIDAYNSDLCDISYDKRLDRCVFMVKNKSYIEGAVGRALGNFKPKWYMYSSSPYPFICGKGKVGILVEDCPSACVIGAAGFSGVALLGTSIKAPYLKFLSETYESLVVALDRDATNKALDMVRELCYYIPSTVRILEKDLKHYSIDEAKEFLNDTG
jgi:hypothetical protein